MVNIAELSNQEFVENKDRYAQDITDYVKNLIPVIQKTMHDRRFMWLALCGGGVIGCSGSLEDLPDIETRYSWVNYYQRLVFIFSLVEDSAILDVKIVCTPSNQPPSPPPKGGFITPRSVH